MFGPICVSISASDPLLAAERLRGLACAELRLDAFLALPKNLAELVAIPLQCLLTCRPGSLSGSEQLDRLIWAVSVQPTLLDVDMDAPFGLRQAILQAAKEAEIEIVLSKHWYEKTPELEILCETVSSMLALKSKFVKLAAFCQSPLDLANLLSLYSVFPNDRQRLVILGMGPQTALARLTILQLGAPFTFAAPDNGPATASGQLRLSQVERILREIESP